mgnify:CR=1 FL=1
MQRAACCSICYVLCGMGNVLCVLCLVFMSCYVLSALCYLICDMRDERDITADCAQLENLSALDSMVTVKCEFDIQCCGMFFGDGNDI